MKGTKEVPETINTSFEVHALDMHCSNLDILGKIYTAVILQTDMGYV